jgi:hypothetical protein
VPFFSLHRQCRFLIPCLICFCGVFVNISAYGFDFFEKTFLVEITQGSELSNKVNFYTVGGFETANGNFVSYAPWYTNHWTDARIAFMTELTPSIGIIWGFSTGEQADKYKIYPNMKIGFAYFDKLSKDSTLSLKATTIIGGKLIEYPCLADYGDIGGVQSVNCRMAASQMPPAETLQYLFNDKPYNQTVVLLEYKILF